MTMKNNKNLSSPWVILPLLFCSVAVLAGDGGTADSTVVMPDQEPDTALIDNGQADSANTVPDTMSQAQQLGKETDGFVDDATETSTLNTGYVGGKTRVGVSLDNDFKAKADLNQVFRLNDNSATIGQAYVGVNPRAKKDKNEKTFTGAGVKLNQHWVSTDGSGNPTHVNKVFGAFDQNEQKDKKLTVGYGQEQENLFWSGQVSKGLSKKREVSKVSTTGDTIFEKGYDYGLGGRVGTFLPDQQMRVQGGLDYEWGKEQADGESKAKQTTISGSVEKFFEGTPHSVGADLEIYKKSGGYVEDKQKVDARGAINYHYDIGSDAGIWQPDKQYKRVRVEIPGEEIKKPPKMVQKLVKHTMELEADTFFELNKAKLTPEAKERMKAVMAQIRDSKYEGNIHIVGHTCDLGTDKHNLDLSQRRANAVRDFMSSNGFNVNELLAEGQGEANPKYPNTEAERHKNRRVDIEYVSYQQQVKEEVVEEGGTSRTDPKVVWRKELIPTPPLWVRQALSNTINYKSTVDTYRTTAGGKNTTSATNDVVTATTATPVTINVLGNDIDPNGDPLSIKSFDARSAKGGTVTKVGSSLSYTSAAGFTGTDTFNYTVQDSYGHTATATVTVTVKAGTINNPPTVAATAIQRNITTNQSFTLDTLDGVSDPGDTVTLASFTNPAHGALVRSGNSLTYTPTAGYVGTDSFTYTITDTAGNKVTVTVSIDIAASNANVTPSATDDSANVASDKTVTIAVLTNDKDPNGDTLSIKSFTQGTLGTVTQSGNNLIYKPSSTASIGVDSFTYTIQDPAGNTATASVIVTITPAGVPIVKDDSATLVANQVKTIDVLANDVEPDGDTLTIQSFTTPDHGSVTQSGNNLVYTPNADYTGTDAFNYTVNDGKGNTATARVSILVNSANGALVTNGDEYPIPANSSVVSLGILANDTIPANTTPTVVIATQPTHGSAVIVGTHAEYMPEANYNGADSFTYKVTTSDGQESTAQVVLNIGDVPKVVDDLLEVELNDTDPHTLDVLKNDTGNELTIIEVSEPEYGTAVISADGKSIEYTLRSDYCTDHSFTYKVKDKYGQTAFATVRVDVAPYASAANTTPTP